ncbi:protein kinase domain-containing protein [Gemmata sp.]|uniref:protein kinase domain-containing protein n=1 Tax=Gemmata sp. TaxID=1914242 RepID=UPI003F72DC83
MAAPALPNPFGPFCIVRPLGEGGMAAVYEVEDTRLGCRLALKVAHADPSSPAALERFHREARFVQRLHHPYVCPVYERGEVAGRHYLTMPLIEGTSLEKRIGLTHQWAEAEAVEVVRRLALALQAVHDAGVVHRDLKPHNVILRPTGEPVLMDFGLARDRTGQESRLTPPGVALGTLSYVAPEQARGLTDEIGPATDVYSLAVLLYLLLTGRVPFDSPNQLTMFNKIVGEPPPRPGGYRPGLSPLVEDVILRALAKSPAERFASMDEFAAALAACRSAARPSPAPPPAASSDECVVPGVWLARPADRPDAEWVKAAATPGKVPPKPGHVYRLVADREATDRHVETLAPRADLEGLDLGRCELVTPAGLAAVARLRGLRTLVLTRAGVGGVPLTNDALAAVAQVESLAWLEAALPGVTDAGLAAVAGLPELAHVALYDCGRVTDAGVTHLGKLPALAALTLGGCGVSDVGMRRLAGLSNLTELTLEECHRVTGAGVALLARLPRLRALTLAGGRGVGDDAVPAAAALPALEWLEVRNCPRVTGGTLASLAGAKRLRALVLVGCRGLTDEGAAGLAQLGTLEHLIVTGCERVTAAAVDRVRRALPRCAVEFTPPSR